MTIIYLDIILYSVGGVVGTMHHLYFSGTAAETMALGAFFSAAEVLPLTFLTVEAWSFLQLGSRQEHSSATPFPHRWAVMFLVAVGSGTSSAPGSSGSWSTCRWCPTTRSAPR